MSQTTPQPASQSLPEPGTLPVSQAISQSGSLPNLLPGTHTVSQPQPGTQSINLPSSALQTPKPQNPARGIDTLKFNLNKDDFRFTHFDSGQLFCARIYYIKS